MIFQIFSQGANGSTFQNLKARTKSIRNTITNFGRNYTNYLKKSSPRLKKVLTWIRKYIDFGIRCQRTVGDYINCISKGKISNKISIHNSLWLKIPSFVRKYIAKKPNKFKIRFMPEAVTNGNKIA